MATALLGHGLATGPRLGRHIGAATGGVAAHFVARLRRWNTEPERIESGKKISGKIVVSRVNYGIF